MTDIDGGPRIQRAEWSDLPALIATFGQESWFRRQLTTQAAGGTEVLLAWSDGRVVGDVAVLFDPPPEAAVRDHLPGTPMISHLEVAPEHRRRGVATALLDEAEALVRRRGHPLVCLGCGITNPARALYDQRGYVDWEYGEVRFAWAEPEPDFEVCHVLTRLLDPDVPGLDAWDPWSPAEAARRLAGCPVPWAVAGGYAVDLFLGRTTRAHADLEIAIPRTEFPRLRPWLSGLRLYTVGTGHTIALPDDAEPGWDGHQIRVAEQGRYRTDVFLEPGTVDTWVSHRDARITRPLAEAIARTADGVPYLRPELVLFAKAKHARPKDEADLTQLMSTMDDDTRRWLAAAVNLAHPGHPWVARIAV